MKEQKEYPKEHETKDEITQKVIKKLEVAYFYYFYGLLQKKYEELDLEDRQISQDLDLVVALRKYLGLGRKNETSRSLFKQIKEQADLI